MPVCSLDRTTGLILFVLQCEQCHIVVLDRFGPQQSDSKPAGRTEPEGRMERWMVLKGRGGGGGRALEGGGRRSRHDMGSTEQTKLSN